MSSKKVQQNCFANSSFPGNLLFAKYIYIFFSVKFPSEDSDCSVENEGTFRSFKKL